MTNQLAETLATQFNMTAFIANRNLDGLTHEESLVAAAPGGNSTNWILGHVVATRNVVLSAVGQQPVWGEEELRRYRRGSGLLDVDDALPLDDIQRAFAESQERLLAGIASVPADDWAKPAPFNVGPVAETLGSLLTKMAIHEGYHLGQTGILRRVVGKEGALK
ncbi:MAG: DinB family protein [Acidobacteria bacterium]|nr:DinB family protein [Acidobacteriota bacterium]MBV9477069.1 DinB family protein [Acidobacteriota bacterium]